MKVFVLSDRPVVVAALTEAISGHFPDFDVAPVKPMPGWHCPAARPGDVALVDTFSVPSAMRLCRMCDEAGMRALVFANDGDTVLRLLQAGALGVVSSESRIDGILEAVATVSRGELFVPSTMLGDVMASLIEFRENAGQRAARIRRLSSREHEVLVLLGEGADQTAIARRLGISTETVKTHISHVLHKLGLQSRMEAAALAFELGLLPSGSRGA